MSDVTLSNEYHTWCIHDDGTIQSNENNFVLVYLGTVRCGALPNTCGWQSQISAFKKDFFGTQQIWEITSESTGFTSLKETITTNNEYSNRKGWLVASDNDVYLKITNKDEIAGQWIVTPAPLC